MITGTLRTELSAVACPATVDGHNMAGDDFALAGGWGQYGSGGAVLPSQSRLVEGLFTTDERATLGDAQGREFAGCSTSTPRSTA